MKLVTVLISENALELIDELVRENIYPSRSSAIRTGVQLLLRKEHKYP
jgi:Arc/MetJ-type ribon-helix-helix transcriptional regulator